MRRAPVHILPGGQLSDVVETAMTETQHQEVTNFRLTRQGEWSTVKGFEEVVAGLSDLRAVVEVTEDRSGDRFLFLQCGYGTYALKRIDINPTTGSYAGQPVQTVSMPGGLTVADTVCRFFLHRGDIRITGGQLTLSPYTDVVLWYGYVKRTLTDTGVDMAQWVLTYAKCTTSGYTHSISTGTVSVEQSVTDEKRRFYYAYFLIMENGQYTLPKAVFTCDALDLGDYAGFCRRAKVSMTESEYTSRAGRITGAGLLVYASAWPEKVDEKSMAWRVADVVDITDAPTKKVVLARLFVTASSPTPCKYPAVSAGFRLYRFFDLDDSGSNYEDNLAEFKAFVYAAALAFGGRKVDVVGPAATVTTHVDATLECFIGRPDPDNYANTYSVEFYFTDDISSTLGGAATGDYTLKFYDQCLLNTSSMVWLPLVADLKNLPATLYSDFTQIPAGTSDTSPNYSGFAVVDGQSYVVSEAEDEGDMLRVSLPMQLDVHPQVNLMATEVGDADRNKAVINRDDRIVILKENSLSQGQNVGGRFSADISLAKVGLYPELGWIIIENVLYFMGRDEVYAFTGGRPEKLLATQRMRSVYRQHVHRSSFFAWDPMDREILLVLNGKILVYQLDFDAWYTRDLGITPLGGLLDYDGRALLFNAARVVTLNPSGTPDESITGRIRTRVMDLFEPTLPKKTGAVRITCQGTSLRVAVYDPVRVDQGEDSVVYQVIDPDNDQVETLTVRPNKLFYGAEIQLETNVVGIPDNTIRQITLEALAFGE